MLAFPCAHVVCPSSFWAYPRHNVCAQGTDPKVMAAAERVDDYCVVRDAGTGDITCTVRAPALVVDGAWGGPPLRGAVLYRNTVAHFGSPIADFALAIVYEAPFDGEELAFYQDGSIRCKGKGLRKGALPGKGPASGPLPCPALDSIGEQSNGGGSSSGLVLTPGTAVVKGSSKGTGAPSTVRPARAI